MTKKDGSRVRLSLICGLVTVALAGCQQNSAGYGAITASTGIQKPETNLSADRGVPVTPSSEVDLTEVAASRRLGNRANAFALLPEESAFNMSQWSDSLVAQQGGYVTEIVPTLDDGGDVAPTIEPVPNWRLSGVLVGAGVMAILDTGSRTYEIYPGMQIPNSPWRVVAIDTDRALLAREGNVLPHEFWVSLSGPITGPGVTVQGQGGGTGGRPAGGPGGAAGEAR